MNRRQFLVVCLLVPFRTRKRYRYRLRTKGKSIIGGTINATDPEDAKNKLRKRYPDCEFLSLREE